jgi:protein ImuB
MPTFAAIFLPDFALQALLRPTPERAGAPIALLPEKSARARIWQCTGAAREAGVVPGMTPSQGQARCAELEVCIRSEAAERSARAALLECAGAFSPYVEDSGPGICTLELRSVRAVDLQMLAGSLRTRLARLQLRAQIGFAANADLALLAAQSASAENGWREVRDAAELHHLPLETLPFPAAMLEILGSWGLRDLGAFVALGREALAARFGPEALPLFAQATGAVVRPLRCLAPAQSYEEAIDLEHEIETLEPLLFLLRRLLEQIIVRLESTYLVAANLTLRLGFPHRPPYERTFKIPAPTARVEVLFRALHTHLERFTAEEPILNLALAAEPCRAPRQQFGLFESALRDPNQFFETLARLAALLGNDRVGFPAIEDTHRPDAFRLRQTAEESDGGGQERPSAQNAPQQAAAGNDGGSATCLTLRRFRPPLPVKVELDAQRQPIALTCAALRGKAMAAQGPVRISGEWWGETGWSRVEWDVELSDGMLCRVYQDRVGEKWFLEGIYD